MAVTDFEYCVLKAIEDLQVGTTLPKRSEVGQQAAENARALRLVFTGRLLTPDWMGFDDEVERLRRDELIVVHVGVPKPTRPDLPTPVTPEPAVEITERGHEAVAEYVASH